MFRSEGAGVRCAIVGALVLLGFCTSASRGKWINPEFWRCQLRPAEFNGYILWVPYAGIREVTAQRFRIETGGHRIWVEGNPAPFRSGDEVSLTGKFESHEGEGVLVLHHIGFTNFSTVERRLSELVSLLILAYVLFLFWRAFNVRLDVEQGIFH